MQIQSTLYKAAELGVILTVLTTLVLVGCGGGGSTSGGATTTGAATSATITPYKGAFAQGATVTIKDANGNPVTLLSGGTVGANGVISVTYNQNVTYPLLVSVTGSYYNEIIKQMETTTVPLRGLITNAAGATNVPVTIITETAVALLMNQTGSISATNPLQAASAVAALSSAGTMYGIPASAVPSFNTATNTTSDPKTILLSALAVIANNQAGATLADKVVALANSLASLNAASAPSDVIGQAALANAITAMTSGASSVAAAGVTPPPAPAISTSPSFLTNTNATIAASNSLIGSWAMGTNTGAGIASSMLTFTSDGHYMHAQVTGTSLATMSWPGVEWGTYTYNASTGALSFACPTVDTNGTAGPENGYSGGFTDWGAPIGTCAEPSFSATVTGNTLTIANNTAGQSKFSRVMDNVNPMVGSWAIGTNSGARIASSMLTFTADGYYMHAQVTGTSLATMTWPGVEWGTYTYNALTGALIFACPTVDTNGTAGPENGYSGGFQNGLMSLGNMPVGTQGGGYPIGSCTEPNFTATVSGNTLTVANTTASQTNTFIHVQ